MAGERWLVTGASGQLGGHVVRQLLQPAGRATVLALVRRDVALPRGVQVQRVDLAVTDELRAAVAGFRPTHIVHLGAMTSVADCYARPAEAEQVNVVAAAALGEAAAECGARLVFSSTDMVFDGDHAPYREGNPPRPPSRYGRTKAAAEEALRGRPLTVVVRIPLLYGFPCDDRSTTFVQQMSALRAGTPLRLFADEFRSPVSLPDAARAVIRLARSDYIGLIHVAGPERLSRLALIEQCAEVLGLSKASIVATSRLDVPAAEPRPADLSLDGQQFATMFPDVVPGPPRRDVL